MALDFYLDRIKNYKSVCYVYNSDTGEEVGYSPATQALAFWSLHTGIGCITKKNASDVYARVKIIEGIYGPMFNPISMQDVLDHIELRTNCVRYTPTQFFSHIRKHVYSTLMSDFDKFNRTIPEGY